MTVNRTDIEAPGPEVGPKSSKLSLIWNLVTRIDSSFEVVTSRERTMVKTGEESPKSESRSVMARIGAFALT